MRGGDDKYSTPIFFNSKPVDVYGGGDKTSGYYSQEGRAAYTSVAFSMPQAGVVAYKPPVQTAGGAGGCRVVEYDKTWAEVTKSLEKVQDFCLAHHVQVDRERETVKELRAELEAKEQEMEDIRASIEQVTVENRELKMQMRTLAPLPEKVKKLSSRLLEYQMAHKKILQAMDEDEGNRATLQVFLDDFGFPAFEEEGPAHAPSRYRLNRKANKDAVSEITPTNTDAALQSTPTTGHV